jgi:hypothetical protein
MLPKPTTRQPLGTDTDRGSAATLWASVGRGIPSLASRISTPIERASPLVFPQAEIDDNEEEDHNTDHDDEDEEEQPEDNDGEAEAHSTHHGDTLQLEFARADLRDMLEQQRKLIELPFQNREMKLKDPESPNRKDKFNVTHLKRYCGSAQE